MTTKDVFEDSLEKLWGKGGARVEILVGTQPL